MFSCTKHYNFLNILHSFQQSSLSSLNKLTVSNYISLLVNLLRDRQVLGVLNEKKKLRKVNRDTLEGLVCGVGRD